MDASPAGAARAGRPLQAMQTVLAQFGPLTNAHLTAMLIAFRQHVRPSTKSFFRKISWTVVHGSALVSYSAGISACDRGEQWLRAMLLLGEMREAKLEPDVIGCNAGISACGKGEQWQRALALLSEMCEAKLEPDVISYSAGISACEKGEQWQGALALLSEMREAKFEPDVVSYSVGVSASEKASYANCLGLGGPLLLHGLGWGRS